ncbi:AAA family ATPase [Streptomyces sp. NPDC056121]|uniref:AAA family ATPase n=1 Tax=unclassified Streptomyces TaxID=2593676 RepID=UPI0035D9B755
MATLFLTCGVAGSGKTTLARKLEQERGALRLTGDAWMRRLYPDLPAFAPAAVRDRVEKLQFDLALQVLEQGIDVVVDWGLLGRDERDHYRTQAQDRGAKVVLCLLDPPLAVLRERLEIRNRKVSADTYGIPLAKLEEQFRVFQRPTPQEFSAFDSDPALSAEGGVRT